eukprot:6992332-Pyramimonas_sp.AAC.1
MSFSIRARPTFSHPHRTSPSAYISLWEWQRSRQWVCVLEGRTWLPSVSLSLWPSPWAWLWPCPRALQKPGCLGAQLPSWAPSLVDAAGGQIDQTIAEISASSLCDYTNGRANVGGGGGLG